MPSPSQISICLPAVGDARDQFVGRLDSLLKHTPLKQVELRFGFALATPCRDYVLGKLVSNAGRLAPVLSRYLDGRPDRSPDLSLHEARPGDRYMICSDGLSPVV